MYQTINENVEYEIVEKRSKFIANLMFIENKSDAEDKIKEIKKKYHDARHNCYAYRILENNSIYEKTSDDGEPSGTAGSPMLNVLQKNELYNVLVVVTIDYENFQNFEYYCRKNNIKIINAKYEDSITCEIEMDNIVKIKFLKDIENKNILPKKIKQIENKYIRRKQ